MRKEIQLEFNEKSHGNLPVTGVFLLAKVQAFQEVAGEFGVIVSVVAEAGQEYPLRNGGKRKVPDGNAYIEIVRNVDPVLDLTPFYKAADELLKQKVEQR